jgi:hypothetical protein
MTTLANTAEGGTNGTTVTGGNSGGASGDAWATSKGATSTLAYSTAHPAHGTMGIRFNCLSGESNFVQWGSLFSSDYIAFRFYHYNEATPGATSTIASVRNSTGKVFDLAIGSDSVPRLIDAASSTKTTGWSAHANDVLHRYEGVITKGTTTSNGRFQVKTFLGDSTTPLAEYDSQTAGHSVDAGTTALTSIRFGRAASAATNHDYYQDSWMAVDQATFIGPYGVNASPIASAGSDQSVLVNTLVTLAGSASDPDGTIADTTWTQVDNGQPTITLSNDDILAPTFTPTVGGVYEFELEVTDDDGATDTDTMTVRVRDTAATVWRVTANPGAFTIVGGADAIEVLGDADNATYVQSVAAPSGASITFELTPLTAGVVTVTLKNQASAASPAVSRLAEIYVNGVLDNDDTFVLGTSVATDTLSTVGAIAADATITVKITDTQ